MSATMFLGIRSYYVEKISKEYIFGRNAVKDKSITCIQCENSFFLTAADQERLFERGFGIPKRCPDCRKKKAKITMEIGQGRKNKEKKRQDRGKRYDLDEE